MTLAWPRKESVLGVGISRVSARDLAPLLTQRRTDRAITVNVCNVHSVISARKDPELAEALESGDLNTSDGMPLVWFLRSNGFSDQTRVNGSEIVAQVLDYGLARGWRHYFYGSTDETLALLVTQLTKRYEGLQIAGTFSPPFRKISDTEREASLATIRQAKPDIVWVGLGMPKQEKWMHAVRNVLPGTVLIGIGAVFDFLAGTKSHAPMWMQDNGLEWLFRLGSEPRRLFGRYLSTNPRFLALWLQSLATRPRSAERSE